MIAFAQRLNARKPVVTYAIAAVIVAVFALEALWGGTTFSPTLARMGADMPSHVRAGEWWRLLSSAFLHAGPMHVIFNVWVLVALGTFLEKLLGPRRYLVLYTLSGVGGSLLSVAFSKAALSVGASGCLWGFLAASGALVLRPAGLIPDEVMPNLRKNALINLGLNVANSFQAGVDFLAHLGGGIVGFLLVFSGLVTSGLIPPGVDPRDPNRRTVHARDGLGWTLAAALSVVALGGSLGMAFVHGKPWSVKTGGGWARRSLGTTGVSVEVPGVTADRQRTETAGTTPEYVFGELPADPALVSVFVVPQDAPVNDPATLREEFQNARGDLMAFRPEDPGSRTEGEPVDTDVGGYPTLTRRWVFSNGLKYTRYAQLRPTHFVVVEYLTWGDGPEALADGGHHVLESLRVQP